MSADEAGYREALDLPQEGPLVGEQINQAYREVVWRAFHGPVGYDLCFLALARSRLLEGLVPRLEDPRGGPEQIPFGAKRSEGRSHRSRPHPGVNPAYLAQRLRRRMRPLSPVP